MTLAVEVPEWLLSASLGAVVISITGIVGLVLRLSSKVAVLEDKVNKLEASSHETDNKLDTLTASVAAMNTEIRMQLSTIQAMLTVGGEWRRPGSGGA